MPDRRHHDLQNTAIYDELVHGRVVDATRRRVLSVVEELWDTGVEGVLLGCTELELLIKQADAELPVYPCTTLHVNAALDRALAG
jgi:aspartate racemase